MTKILDGKKTGERILIDLKRFIEEEKITPGLAVIIIGNNPASKLYVANKEKACEKVGIASFVYNLPKNIKEEKLLELISLLNKNKKVNGILVQLPLPDHLDKKKIIESINPLKDVDGFHPINIGNLCAGNSSLEPCTPAGIMELLNTYKIKVSGTHAVVVGRSNIVGKPVAQMLLNANATITICHSKTKKLATICRQADILIAAVGTPKFIKKNMLKNGVVVVDVAINRDNNGKLCGDVDFDNVKNICKAITPVPGGVGPMTIAMLMRNCVGAYYLQKKSK